MRRGCALLLAALLTGPAASAAPDAASLETAALTSIPVYLEEKALEEPLPEEKPAASKAPQTGKAGPAESAPALRTVPAEKPSEMYLHLIEKDSPVSFLTDIPLPRDWSFTPFAKSEMRTALHAEWAGLLRVRDKDTDQAFLAVGVEMKGAEADRLFGGMYAQGGFAPETAASLLRFNMILMRSGVFLNEAMLNAVISVNEGLPPADRYPYSLLSVDTGSPEQLHPMGEGKDRLFTFGYRPVFVADQWMLPIAVRGYAYRKDGAYRFLLLGGLDSGRAAMEKAGAYILEKDRK